MLSLPQSFPDHFPSEMHVTANLGTSIRQSYSLFSQRFWCLGEDLGWGTLCNVCHKEHDLISLHLWRSVSPPVDHRAYEYQATHTSSYMYKTGEFCQHCHVLLAPCYTRQHLLELASRVTTFYFSTLKACLWAAVSFCQSSYWKWF